MTYNEYQQEVENIRKEKMNNSDNSWNILLDSKWQYLDANWKNIEFGTKYYPPQEKSNQYTKASDKIKKDKQAEEKQIQAWKDNQYGGYE